MSAHTTHDGPKALMDLWRILKRHRWRFVAPMFLASAAVLVGAMLLPRKYRAVAAFERRTDIVLSEMSQRGATRSFTDPRQSLAEELAGGPAVHALLQKLEPTLREAGLVVADTDLLVLRDEVTRGVLVSYDIATPELDRARVEFVGRDPRLTEIVVNGLIEQYIERSRATMEARLRGSAAFFQAEVARNREQIEALENAILEFEIANGSLLPDTPNNVQDKLDALDEALATALAVRDAAAMRITAIQQALAETPAELPTVVRSANPEVKELEARDRELRTLLSQLTVEYKMTEVHPEVINARAQLAEVARLLRTVDREVVTERQLAANPKRAELELQLTQATGEHRAAADQAVALRQQMDDLAASTASLFEVRSKHRKMLRELQENQRQLTFWEDNLRRIDMALAAETGNRGVQLELLQRAHASGRPVSPAMAQVVMAAVLLGGIAGGLSIFLAHRSDETFADGEELARVAGLPLLGSVGELVTHRYRRTRTLRQAVLYPSAGLAMSAVLVGAGAVLYADLEDPDALDAVKAQATAWLDELGSGEAQAAIAEVFPGDGE